MSVPDNDLPGPDEFRREMAALDRDFARGRRLLAGLSADDAATCNAVLCEIVRSGRGSQTLMALAQQTLDFGRVLEANNMLRNERNDPITFQQWIDAAAMSQLDVAAADLRELDGD